MARNVYVYDLNTYKLIHTFGCQKDTSVKLGIPFLKEMLNRSYCNTVVIDNKIITKNMTLNLKDVENILSKQFETQCRKRFKREFVCDYCGKVFTKLLNDVDYKNYRNKSTKCCGECNKNGNFFKGKPKSASQKEKMSKSSMGRKWINNGIVAKQLKEPQLTEYLNKGWVLGQLKRDKGKGSNYEKI